MSDSEEEKCVDMAKEARTMWKNSKVLRNMASHVCSPSGVEVQCRETREGEWVTVPEDGTLVQKESLDKKCYRITAQGRGPLRHIAHLFDEPRIADQVNVIVKLFADQAEIKVQFVMTSRDVGYEESPVFSCMKAIETGTWLSKHNVFPTVEQFNDALGCCLVRLGLDKWREEKKWAQDVAEEGEEADQEENEKQVKKEKQVKNEKEVKKEKQVKKEQDTSVVVDQSREKRKRAEGTGGIGKKSCVLNSNVPPMVRGSALSSITRVKTFR